MQRDMGRPSLAEFLLPEKLGHNERLERIDEAVDWDRLGGVVAGIYASREGRPSYPPLTMVKVLLLEQWYNLSDPQMEEAFGGSALVPALCGVGAARRHAGSCDDQPVSDGVGAAGVERAVVWGVGGPVGGAGIAGEGRDVAGRNVGGSPGTATVDRCGTGSEE